MLPVLSDITPINGGKMAPPTIDITRNEEAIFVSSPRSFIPSAKMVGNMIDMKNGTATTEYTATSPFVVSATVNSTMFINEYKANNFEGFTYRINQVPANR